MKSLVILTMFACLFSAKNVLADIYKRVDETGRITYSNLKTPGAERLEIGIEDDIIKNDAPKSVAKPPQSKTISTPNSFPRVDKQTQNQRDDKRKQILQAELESEKQALLDAQQAYVDGESKPEVYRKINADGSSSTLRNVQKFNAKMESLRAEVESHQNNIQLLQKEINALH